MRDLGGSQVRQLIDTEQLYEAWRNAERERLSRYSGSMAWKVVRGRRYLYRKQRGDWRSLGPESDETLLIHERFHAGRTAARQRVDTLDAALREMAPVNRALRLGRVPWTAARILRRLDRLGTLGQGFRVVGTNALYAYERLAGVQLDSDVVATQDIDLLYDARGRLKLVGTPLGDTGLLGVLQDLDGSFAVVEAGSFRAANGAGYLVDLITPSGRNPATRNVRRKLAAGEVEDLSAVEIDGLTWLENSPAIETVAIDERGFPLPLVTPDPRAFVCHKLWVADRIDREPVKARRDRAQAAAVAVLLGTHLPHLSFEDPALAAIPRLLRERAAELARSLRAARKGDDASDWS